DRLIEIRKLLTDLREGDGLAIRALNVDDHATAFDPDARRRIQPQSDSQLIRPARIATILTPVPRLTGYLRKVGPTIGGPARRTVAPYSASVETIFSPSSL